MSKSRQKTKGVADHIDKYVGQQLREKRVSAGLSQEKLADIAGITFQQIQKYERGTNRVAAGRLFQFARFFEVPTDSFFPEYKKGGA